MQDLYERIKRENYFESLTLPNLRVRNEVSGKIALDNYMANVRIPNHRENTILEYCITMANRLIGKNGFEALYKLPWKILIAQDHIESGFPHTHFDFIIIPKAHVMIAQKRPRQLCDTLIHEKIHIFQRFYPIESHILYTRFWQLTLLGTRDTIINSLDRQNPDTDNLIYGDNHIPIVVRLKNNATNLGDVQEGDTRDHPHEMMAYVITYIISEGTSYMNPILKGYVKAAREFLKKQKEK